MKTLIRLRIEQFSEEDEEYFVATSADLEGLVAEGKTIEEVVEIAQDVAKLLLELDKKSDSCLLSDNIPSVIEYPLILEV